MIKESITNNLFGHYQIISKLAEYPSHITYVATQDGKISRSGQMQSIGEPVTLKIWNSTLDQERFIQHIQQLTQLWHAHIVATLDAGVEQDLPYLVSAYAVRGSLRERLQRQAPYPLSVPEALTIITHIGQALVYAHKNNVIHGAVKPENIVFNENNEPLLTDFRVSPDAPCVPYSDIFTYMAPEQLEGQTTRKSDQYALACVAYELLTGYVPFAGAETVELQQQQLTHPIVPLRQLQPTIPAYIEQTILRALSLRAEYRFPTIDKFIMALHTAPRTASESGIVVKKQERTNPPPLTHASQASQPLQPRPMPLASSASQDSASFLPPAPSAAATNDVQAASKGDAPHAPPMPQALATPLVLSAQLEPSKEAPAELHSGLTLPMLQQSFIPPFFHKRKKSVLLGLACVACIVVLATAGMLSLLKAHTSSTTPSPNNGVINITVNTQPGKQHTASATPPNVQHFAATPTAVPTYAQSATQSTPTAVPVALFNATHLPPPGTVDLTNEGQLDWVQWGMNGPESVNHKAGVPSSSQIGSYSVISGGALKPFSNSATNYTWSDGTPSGNTGGTNTGVGMSGSGNGFQLTVPADTTARTLRVYVGILHAQANFIASFSEKNSMVYSDTQQSGPGGMKNFMYVIQFEATSTAQSLTIKFIFRHALGGGMITLQAATLQ